MASNRAGMMTWLRRFKPAYSVFNFFNRKKLKHNIPLYKALGLKKAYYSSISSKDFENLTNTLTPSGSVIANPSWKNDLNQMDSQSIDDYDANGYVILRGFLTEELSDRINEEIHRLKNIGKLSFKYNGKLNQAAKHSELIKSVGLDKRLTQILDYLLQGQAKLFHSINFIKGSEQDAHSDSIHMTTFPKGGLLGVWIALEDTDAHNGPLYYYPGSHTLPYYLNKDYDNEGTRFFIGNKDYSEYEKMMREKLGELNLPKKVFHAKKGDVLIWHANLIHGGEPQTDPNRTRKSMVFHYFKEGCVCYHEISQRPALMENFS